MTIINKLLNILFLYKNNKISEIKFQNMKDFRIYMENLKLNIDEHTFNNLTEEDKSLIKSIILNYNYPKKLKPSAKRLYEYTDIENLLFCAINLLTITIEKSLMFRELNGSFLLSEGTYYSVTNQMRYHRKDAIPHEFLHMSSRAIYKKDGKSCLGFGTFKDGKFYAQGLNEGCTEMLSRRIFFDEDYNGNSYTSKVYSLRLLELLYEDRKLMERDFLRANFEGFKETILNYASTSELEKIIYALDMPEWYLTAEEKLQLLLYIKNIISRKENTEKSEEIIDEFKTITKARKY